MDNRAPDANDRHNFVASYLVSASSAASFSHLARSVCKYLSANNTALDTLRSSCTAPRVSALRDIRLVQRDIISKSCFACSTFATDSPSMQRGAKSYCF